MASTPVATRRPPARTGASRPRSGTRSRPPARRRRPRRGLPKLGVAGWLLVAVAVLLVLAWSWNPPAEPEAAPTGCPVPGSTLVLTDDELANARTIAQVGVDRGLPRRAVVIALATALQESHLRNLDYGDRDSLGLFQQRPSQGWGTPTQVQDPAYAAGAFYDHLVQVPGWEGMRLTDAAQSVQRSGYPEYYQKHEADASALAAALVPGVTPCG